MPTFREWAGWYAEKGFRVFPTSPQKVPLIADWVHKATTDPEQLDTWWAARPEANIAVAMDSDIIVLDVDRGGEATILARDLSVPATATCKTRNGYHYWYRLPVDLSGKVPQQTKLFHHDSGLDTRTYGGNVLVPPSIHHTGWIYEWITPPTENNIAEAPDWLIEACRGLIREAEASSSHLLPYKAVDSALILSGVSEGSRDRTLFELASSLRRRNVRKEEAIELVLLAASRCDPPFPPDEAVKKVESAWKYTPAFVTSNPETTPPVSVPGKRWSVRELLNTTFDKGAWVVDQLLPVGLHMVVAPSKAGKSYLMNGIAADVALGRPVLGQFGTFGADVVNLDLEQVPRRAMTRWEQIFSTRPLCPENLHTYFEWPSMDNGGLDALQRELDLIKTTPPAMVVIDIWAKFAPAANERANAYYQEYGALTKLGDIAREREIAITVVHHTNKMGAMNREQPLMAINGSIAMSGCPDTIWVLFRDPGSIAGDLYVTGKEVEERWINMIWHPKTGNWRLRTDEDDYEMSGSIYRPRPSSSSVFMGIDSHKTPAVASAEAMAGLADTADTVYSRFLDAALNSTGVPT